VALRTLVSRSSRTSTQSCDVLVGGMAEDGLYDVLGLTPSATAAEIVSACERLLVRHAAYPRSRTESTMASVVPPIARCSSGRRPHRLSMACPHQNEPVA
jgi:hypothetical protein